MLKLTLVSIWYRGIRHPFFVMATHHADGKTRITTDDLDRMLALVGVRDHETFSLGA